MEMNFFNKFFCLTIFSEEDLHFNFKCIHNIYYNKLKLFFRSILFIKSPSNSELSFKPWMWIISFQDYFIWSKVSHSFYRIVYNEFWKWFWIARYLLSYLFHMIFIDMNISKRVNKISNLISAYFSKYLCQ